MVLFLLVGHKEGAETKNQALEEMGNSGTGRVAGKFIHSRGGGVWRVGGWGRKQIHFLCLPSIGNPSL